MRRKFYKTRNITKKSEKNLEGPLFPVSKGAKISLKCSLLITLKLHRRNAENKWLTVVLFYQLQKNSVTSSRWLFKTLYIGNSFEQITRPTTTNCLTTIYQIKWCWTTYSTTSCDNLLMRTVPISKMGRTIYLCMSGFFGQNRATLVANCNTIKFRDSI